MWNLGMGLTLGNNIYISDFIKNKYQHHNIKVLVSYPSQTLTQETAAIDMDLSVWYWES